MARRLIINADDLGYDPAVTRGILESMRRGVVSSGTFMVNTPHSEAAARAAGGLSIGLHLNLARHPPVWASFPRALLVEGGLAEARAAELPPEVVEQETLAQLARLEFLLGQSATHVDVHKHLHRHPNVLEGLCRAAAATKLPVRSIDPEMRATLQEHGVVTNDHFIGEAGREAYWSIEQLEASLTALEEGVTELMCHPGYAPTTLTSGYSHQRELELKTFTSGQARALLARLQLTPETFAAL